MLKEAPALETGSHPETGQSIYRTSCPWCSVLMPWAISWIAVWREFAEHFNIAHRDIQDALKEEWRAALPPASDI